MIMAIEMSSFLVKAGLLKTSDYGSVVSINVLVTLLCACIVIGHLLEENRWMNESITAIAIGLCTGVIILFTTGGKAHIFWFSMKIFSLYTFFHPSSSMLDMEEYPKFRVRQQEDQDDDQSVVHEAEEEDTSFHLLHDFDSLSFQENRSHSVSPITCSGPEKINVTETEKGEKNLRASPVLRPRAVLSSPDNDGMIGNVNKIPKVRSSERKKHDAVGIVRERPLVRKKHDSGVKEPGHGNVKSRTVKTISSLKSTKGSKETNLKEKLEPIDTRQKVYLRKGKLNT